MKGRGGNQTPRSESIAAGPGSAQSGVSIHSSQPLPSPSSSFGSSPTLDKWAFGMSKLSGAEGAGAGGEARDAREARDSRKGSPGPFIPTP